ncbi:purine-nucleoside phosphorylase [Butyricicoccus sp.]|uniref:purine-nucleoside phosphorylase n=1 Tax=Butyricicoccus sp. TaxID=2049021 RepID=UPI003F174EC6
MNPTYEKLMKCYDSLRAVTDFQPQLALVLGSGLGNFAERIRIVQTVDYSAIEGFPTSTVEGHRGRYVFGYVDAVPVVVMQGRVHYYEGYDISDVVLPIRLMKLMGAEILMVTNASGGICAHFHAGDLMLISDHIASFIPSPLRGANIDELGTRFPDMTDTYDPALRAIIRTVAVKENIPLQEGVYIQLPGPQFETPAEIRMARALGADAVGMSTACEVVAARHMGMRVCGISCVSNMAAGMADGPLLHEEVQQNADLAAPRFEKLVWKSIVAIAKSV